MTSQLTPKNLQKIYGKGFHIEHVAKNIHDSTVRDTILAVNTAADKLKLFKNKYSTHLISATLTSQHFTFGSGIRIGATKAAFCKAFGLSTKYDLYEIAIFPEAAVGISFSFKNSILTEASYRIIYDVD